ncbi:MAG: FAD-binding oxidoreductase [Kiritimatiellae bacterium]|jgi:D-lactate dehydrogenase (cytochrome)|nr:FAD-binding oxidoreductase [Kiritimatiellia bacterium]
MFTTNIPADFLHDESRRIGSAAGIAFPKSTADVQAALQSAHMQGSSVTVQGARTGIAGGAVPDNDLIISLARMNHIISPVAVTKVGEYTITVQPGLLLSELQDHLKNVDISSVPLSTSPLIFPPDPTEASASIGGMTACNASGACSFAYGATRKHIKGITVILANGDSLTLKRGENFATGRTFEIITDQGNEITGKLPQYNAPTVKSAAGYWIKPDMELIDLFIGSEGTLGIITEIELALTPAPAELTGIICFFSRESQTVDFVNQLRTQSSEVAAQLNAIEYFNEGALNLIHASAPKTGLLLPKGSQNWKNAIYIEWAQSNSLSGEHLILVSQLMQSCGASADDTWLASDAPGLKRMKAFRHAVPEQVNSIISERKRKYPELTKLGTDLSVPDSQLQAVMNLYHTGLQAASLEYVIFGHIGDNHVHVNIIPRNMEEYATGKALYTQWAKQVVEWGGSVSAEHGIGTLKKELLAVMYGNEQIQAMRELKALFDPSFMLNPNRLFEAEI